MAGIAKEAEVVGRDAELDVIDGFLAGGPARALLLEGEAGIGKTTGSFV